MIKKNEGITTIVVVCVMAIIMTLSMGLFLTASVLIRTAAKASASEQCRILAVTFSEQIEEQLVSADNVFESRLEEETARAQDVRNVSLWHYVKENITDGSWPYYEEPGSALHNKQSAVRSFRMDASGIASEIAVTEIFLYWIHGEDESIPESLVVKTEVTVKEQSCIITDTYRLQISGGNGYESWLWEHVDKR